MDILIDKFVEDIKALILEKRNLVSERDGLKNSVRGGYDYFSNNKNNPDPHKLAVGAERMMEIISELSSLDKKIFDIDTVIVSKLEMYLGNFVISADIPERINQAGDISKITNIKLVPFKNDDTEVSQISPEDIWFLKMIKEAVKATNITFELKE